MVERNHSGDGMIAEHDRKTSSSGGSSSVSEVCFDKSRMQGIGEGAILDEDRADTSNLGRATSLRTHI